MRLTGSKDRTDMSLGTLVLIAVLFLAVMVLIIVEICTPFFGLLGVVAVALACLAVYLAYGVHPLFGLVLGVAALIGLPIYTIVAVKILPGTALGRKLHLHRAQAAPGEATPEADKLSRLVGRKTKAETLLRPSGMIRVDGDRIVAQAESDMIAKGEEVEIVRAAGNHVVVRRIEKS